MLTLFKCIQNTIEYSYCLCSGPEAPSTWTTPSLLDKRLHCVVLKQSCRFRTWPSVWGCMLLPSSCQRHMVRARKCGAYEEEHWRTLHIYIYTHSCLVLMINMFKAYQGWWREKAPMWWTVRASQCKLACLSYLKLTCCDLWSLLSLAPSVMQIAANGLVHTFLLWFSWWSCTFVSAPRVQPMSCVQFWSNPKNQI